MKSKTLKLLEHYKILIEQGEDPNAQDPNSQPQDVQNVVDPNAGNAPDAEEELPLTSQGEDKYISDLIDAALFAPSPEDSKTLLNLQNVMQMKRYKNAREEVLPLVLSLISSETQSGDIKKDLSRL